MFSGYASLRDGLYGCTVRTHSSVDDLQSIETHCSTRHAA